MTLPGSARESQTCFHVYAVLEQSLTQGYGGMFRRSYSGLEDILPRQSQSIIVLHKTKLHSRKRKEINEAQGRACGCEEGCLRQEDRLGVVNRCLQFTRPSPFNLGGVNRCFYQMRFKVCVHDVLNTFLSFLFCCDKQDISIVRKANINLKKFLKLLLQWLRWGYSS